MKSKRIMSAMVALSMCFSMAACVNNDQAKEDILDVVEKHASKVVKNYDADNGSRAVNSAIEDTLEFEIDEKSLDINRGEASVDVVFTIVDFDDIEIPEVGFMSEADILDAIDDARMQEIEITYELELDGKKWVITNEDDISDDFADVAYYDVNFNWYLMDDDNWYLMDINDLIEDITEPSSDTSTSGSSYTGRYATTTNMVAVLNETAPADAQFEGYCFIDSILHLNEDGTFTIELEDPQTAMDNIRNFMISNFATYAYVYGGVTEDELAEMMDEYGYSSYEEVVDSSYDSSEILGAVAFNNSGTYTVMGNDIIFNADDGDVYEGYISSVIVEVEIGGIELFYTPY